jgi:hypothetical protein
MRHSNSDTFTHAYHFTPLFEEEREREVHRYAHIKTRAPANSKNKTKRKAIRQFNVREGQEHGSSFLVRFTLAKERRGRKAREVLAAVRSSVNSCTTSTTKQEKQS